MARLPLKHATPVMQYVFLQIKHGDCPDTYVRRFYPRLYKTVRLCRLFIGICMFEFLFRFTVKFKLYLRMPRDPDGSTFANFMHVPFYPSLSTENRAEKYHKTNFQSILSFYFPLIFFRTFPQPIRVPFR